MWKFVALFGLMGTSATAQGNCAALYRSLDEKFISEIQSATRQTVDNFMFFEMGSAPDDEERARRVAETAASEAAEIALQAYLERRRQAILLSRFCP